MAATVTMVRLVWGDRPGWAGSLVMVMNVP